ncbi:MAG: insulinase family protein [Chitinophagales bacterium]|nr:insulinase family protein [Chitinophagales bacterium]
MKKITLIALLLAGTFCYTNAQEKSLRQAQTIAPSQHSVPNMPIPGVIQPAQVAAESNFETVADDPMKVRIYTLKNGLKVYLSVNKDAPRIQTLIAVKAGSKFDPPQTTGLAHYLEHMVFKGTSEFSTANWISEKVLLDSISANFEYHKNEKDEAKKKLIYARIDSFSFEASKFAIPNEYDKMMTSLGAQGTNAFTSTDMTVYVNDIPSNAVEKFLKLESNRFQQLVLRLFHTELETVYEEFNRSQDNDRRWSYHNVINALLPNHPYGTQTTIGEGEHLKNPSMVNIHNYFNTYYRPNNVAIIMAGDLDPDKTVQTIEQYFGSWQAAPIPNFIKQPEPEITEPVSREYSGPQPEHVYVGFRFNGANTREAMMVKLVDMILANGEAGLIDLDLVQQQKVLQAYSFVEENADYCIHMLYGEPKQGQKMEEVKDLLLNELDKIKTGMFGDWLLPAIVQNLRLQRMKAAEKNDKRAEAMMNAFIYDIPWKDWLNEVDEMAKITKEDIVRFASKHYKQNYAVCYKRQGEANVHKVEKPKITPVVMNKDISSNYKKNWDAMPQPSIQPKFMDFEKDIERIPTTIAGVPLHYIRNDLNKTFVLQYIFDMGTDNIRELGLAVDYLQYLGAGKYTAEYIKTEFYKMGLAFSVNSSRDRVSISLSGLEENLRNGVELLEYLLANVKPDKEVYETMVMDILQKRENAKKNKNAILSNGLGNYAKYGKVNPFNTVISEDELKNMSTEKLTSLIKSLYSYKHKVFYYGQNEPQRVLDVLREFHKPVTPLKDYPPARKFPELPINANKVYVSYYPMKQTEVVLLARDGVFNKDLYPYIFLYNEYYGSGLSSIMFQEIREKMALAYSVNSSFGVPQYAHESHYISSYVGTQADKLDTALQEMNRLLNDMPEVEQQFEGAKASLIKTFESDWITRSDIYAAYERAQRRGLNYDVRKEIYEKVKNITVKDLHAFFDKHIKGKNYAYLVIGKKEDINMNTLKKLGPVQELELKELFGY